MKIKLTKLYKGNIADLKDFQVEEAIKKNKNYLVEYAGETMTLSPEDLKKKVIATSALMQNKYVGGKDYKLLSYKWNPDG